MFETIGPTLQDFIRNIRIIDFLDVALISVVCYLLLNWLIQSISRKTLLGFSILLAIYVFARLTGMYLTELLIQALFFVILIGLVVVFQSDIRRIVDRIGNWNFFANNKAPSYSNTATNIITEAVAHMADRKTGALIVIRGKEDWERHIDGGIPLNGKLSIPMLYSIFNPTAPGHDGAILLEGDSIVRFGTHLPLSKNMGSNFAGGTRHAAALGMSEHCDSLVLVVSEERGTISVARSGELKIMDSSSDLKKVLDDFWDEHYQVQDSPLINWWKKRNLRTAIASVALAVALWFAFAYQTGTVYRNFSVPIEYLNLQSSNVAVQDSLPIQARVTLSGPEQAFRSLDPSDLVISFNLNEVDLSSGELRITESNINVSNDLNLYDVNPRSLKIKPAMEQLQLPIKVDLIGNFRKGIVLTSINVDPKSIPVMVEPGASIPDSIATKSIDLSSVTQSTEIRKEIVLPQGLTLPEKASQEVTISIRVRTKTD